MSLTPSARTRIEAIDPGTIIEGKYEVLGLIGSGGFAQVYEARQINIDRSVAIKVLNSFPDQKSQESYEERFLREAKVAAQIDHPNVVTIYDFGVTAHGQPFIVMEMMVGHDLRHEIKRYGAMDPDRGLWLFMGVLDALGNGHDKGIVHKDLKPANLFIHQPGQRNEAMKVLDFGIARSRDQTRITQSEQVLGTPKYYAPEYLRSQLATPALDVYQMGLILVEMFSATPVVQVSDTYTCLMIHVTGELDIPKALIESPLGPVLIRALAQNHTRRFKDAHAFLAALEQISSSDIPHIEPGFETVVMAEVAKNFDWGSVDLSSQSPTQLRSGSFRRLRSTESADDVDIDVDTEISAEFSLTPTNAYDSGALNLDEMEDIRGVGGLLGGPKTELDMPATSGSADNSGPAWNKPTTLLPVLSTEEIKAAANAEVSIQESHKATQLMDQPSQMDPSPNRATMVTAASNTSVDPSALDDNLTVAGNNTRTILAVVVAIVALLGVGIGAMAYVGSNDASKVKPTTDNGAASKDKDKDKDKSKDKDKDTAPALATDPVEVVQDDDGEPPAEDPTVAEDGAGGDLEEPDAGEAEAEPPAEKTPVAKDPAEARKEARDARRREAQRRSALRRAKARTEPKAKSDKAEKTDKKKGIQVIDPNALDIN